MFGVAEHASVSDSKGTANWEGDPRVLVSSPASVAAPVQSGVSSMPVDQNVGMLLHGCPTVTNPVQ